jgi:hypothetical protein
MIQYSSTLLLYFYSVTFMGNQYLWGDLFTSTSLTITMALTAPAERLSIIRLPSTLLGMQNLLSVFGVIVIQFIAQVVIL